ncbi:hypothetical protein RND81_11G232300 [Saponaria officinalis]
MFLSEDSPSQIGRKAEDHLKKTASLYSNEMRTPGSRSKEHSSTSKQIHIPVIKWKCPPMFTLESEWQVAAGEESEERTTQKYRETRVLEALYPRLSAIPSSPRVSAAREVNDYDDTQTPIIPLTPIEDEVAVPTESTPCSESAESNVPTESKAIANEKLRAAAAGIDADIVAAATAALTAMLKTNEKGSMVDTDLLIKILNEPKMIEAFSKTSTTKTASPIDPSHEALTILRPNSKPHPDAYSISLSGKPVDNESDLSRKVVPASSSALFGSNLNPQISDLEPSRPSSLVSLTRPADHNLSRETQTFISSLPLHSSISTSATKPVPASSTTIFVPISSPLVSSQPPSLVSSTRWEDLSLSPKSQMFTNSSTSPSSVETRIVKDANYYKNLIRLHGNEGNQTQEHQTLQFQVSAPETKVRKPCKFFNSSKGCRNGPTCPFEHVLSPNLQAGKFMDAHSHRSKRLKISTEITG